MDRLTKGEIIQWREWSKQGQSLEFRKLLAHKFQTLCDLALQALSLESVRSGALREAAEELADLMDDVVAGNYTPDHFTTQPIRRALSPARVAEGGE